MQEYLISFALAFKKANLNNLLFRVCILKFIKFGPIVLAYAKRVIKKAYYTVMRR